MDTVKTDGQKRVKIPDALPGQMFAFKNNGDGTRTLTEIKSIKPSVPKAKVFRDNEGVLVMSNGRKPTREQIQRELDELPLLECFVEAGIGRR